jgi:hypothetical protein
MSSKGALSDYSIDTRIVSRCARGFAWNENNDDEAVYFGNDDDVSVKWDATNSLLEFLPGTDDTGAVTIGDGTTDMDVKIFLGSSTEYVLFDVGDSTVKFGVDGTGLDVVFYGDTSSNTMTWDVSARALVFVAAGITMGTTSVFILPVKAAGTATTGDIWLDTTDNKLHFYDGSSEATVTSV